MDDLLLYAEELGAPANDDIANAITLTPGTGSSSTIVMDGATTEVGEPDPTGTTIYKSVWFKFTATANDTAVFDTEGGRASDAPSGDGEAVGSFGHLDTLMGVYSGASPTFGSLSLLSSNDDTVTDPTGLWSRISMSVFAGTTYWVQVGVFDPSYVGTIGLNWTIPNVVAGTATPATVAGIGSVPAPTGLGAATATPSAVAGVGAVPAASAVGASSSTATPSITVGVGSVPAPTILLTATVAPSVVAGVGAVPAATGKGVAKATPAVVAGIGQVPTNGFASPAAVAGVGAIPHPDATGVGTGGGGGSVNGVTDFWVLKGLT